MVFSSSKRIIHTMKRITKDKSDRVTRKSAALKSESQENSEKLDLSKFKIAPKAKLSNKKEPPDDPGEPSTIPKAKSSKREHIKIESHECKKETSPTKIPKIEGSPPNWEEVWANVKEMRKGLNAPVDSMGCDKCQDESATPEAIRYQALLSLMLSSQTRDQITHAAMMKLIEHGCTIDKILETSDEKLGELIYPVSFWKNKVKYIKKSTLMLKNEYQGDIPRTAEDLCKLAGVGPKMAHLCMQTAWNEVTGIGVDTHVHRITNRLGWVKTKTPEDTRKALESWLPRDLWREVGLMLVGFGQQTCQPVKPKCSDCLNNSLCPFGVTQVRKEKPKSK